MSLFRLNNFIILKQCIIFVIFAGFSAANNDDKPCAAKPVFNRSVLCVCDASYCDTIHREELAPGEYATYVSTESGLRFQKSKLLLEAIEKTSNDVTTLILDPTTKYQTIHGFGGAVTDSAGINWDSLPDPKLKQHLIESYFGPSGLEYNMMRVPIGGTDFSTHEYAYNELPEGDAELKNFTLAPEDYKYKLPMIKACMKVATANIDIVSATWAPPKWMRDDYEAHNITFLKKKYYKTYVDYHRKFIEEYEKEGVKIWAISTTNEAINGAVNMVSFNKLGWTASGMGEWISDYLGPTMKKYHPELKLLGGDDQRNTLPIWFNDVMLFRSEIAEILDGMAVHFYNNKHSPPTQLIEPFKDYPHMFVISTEACAGAFDTVKVDLGSWGRAELYANDIIENLNHNVIGWLDWNLCLNQEGGPNWDKNFVDSPIIVAANESVFYKQPMFYAMGHFSKFVPRGSRRIHSEDSSSSLNHVAVLTPRDTVVVVILNDKEVERNLRIVLDDSEARLVLKSKSITTIEFNKEDKRNS